MVGKQRTFELIPTTFARPVDQPRRMTSKQVKKAYQQKNKGPKVSRAEQRRLDAEELAKQKKEYERERASAKAKAVREKKAAKELAEKAERRSKGLPEPSRFVRASQPMISMFVKKGNNKRTWEVMEEAEEEVDESEGTVCDQEEENEAAERERVHIESEDEFGDFPSLSQSNIPELLALTKSTSPGKKPRDNVRKASAEGKTDDKIRKSTCSSNREQSLPPPMKEVEDDHDFEDEGYMADMVTIQLLSEAADAASKSEDPDSPLAVAPQLNPRSVLQDRSVNMRPPSPKRAKLLSTISTPPRLKILNKIFKGINRPPSATQRFLENHLEDFFPSPSQEVRELLEDLDDIPSNTQIAKELDDADADADDEDGDGDGDGDGEPLDHTVKQQLDANDFELLISTQEFSLSSQDLLEIDTPSRLPSKLTFTRSGLPQPLLRRSSETPREDSASTRQIPPPPNTVAASIRRPRRRFFEEKDDDLLHAALHESKVQLVEKELRIGSSLKEVTTRVSRTLVRVSSSATDYGDEEFNDQEMRALMELC